MVSQKYRGSCIGAALAKWLAKNTVASQKMALEEKMEDGALEMLLGMTTGGFGTRRSHLNPTRLFFSIPKLVLFKKLKKSGRR